MSIYRLTVYYYGTIFQFKSFQIRNILKYVIYILPKRGQIKIRSLPFLKILTYCLSKKLHRSRSEKNISRCRNGPDYP